MTTEHVKLSRHVKDCKSLRQTFLTLKNVFNKPRHFDILSWGKRASDLHVSSSIPAKDRTVFGPTVFLGAMGTPKSLQK